MVEAPHASVELAQTIKAKAALARVDGLAEGLGFQKVCFFEVEGARQPDGAAGGDTIVAVPPRWAGGSNFAGQTHFDYMTVSAAFHQAQGTLSSKPADGLSHRPAGDTSTAGEPGDGKPELRFPFEAAMPQKMRIDRAVDDGEAQPRDEKVLKLFPEEFSIQFFVFHGLDPVHASGVRRRRSEIWGDRGKGKKCRSGRRTAAERARTVNLALSEGVEPERTGQVTRKKVKGKLSGDNLPQ